MVRAGLGRAELGKAQRRSGQFGKDFLHTIGFFSTSFCQSWAGSPIHVSCHCRTACATGGISTQGGPNTP